MKVIFYNHTGQVSGAERVMLMILAGVDRSRFKAAVICPKEGTLTSYCQELEVPVSNIRTLSARFTWKPSYLIKYLRSFFHVIFELREKVVDADPDLIHANTIRAGLVATTATLGTRIPVIWHLHDMLPHHPLSTFIRWYAALSSRTHLLAISHAVAKRFRGQILAALGGCAKIRVIHNGINLKRFSIDPAARKQGRHELGVDESQFMVGIVGQVTERKGQRELIHAFARACKQIPRAVLVIVGEPLFNDDKKYWEELKQETEALGIAGQVVFTGARNDIPAVMQSFDLLAVNSKVEPFGLVVLEAMACGTAVLATAVDGVPELIDHEVTGWLVPAGDERRLAEALVTLGNNPGLRKKLAENGCRDTAPRFSADKYLTLVEGFYSQSGAVDNRTPVNKLAANN